MAEEHDRSMMENLYWWGIPTLFRCPNLPAEGQDIALVGVPHSTGNGTTERDQHLGPRAVRRKRPHASRVAQALSQQASAPRNVIRVPKGASSRT